MKYSQTRSFHTFTNTDCYFRIRWKLQILHRHRRTDRRKFCGIERRIQTSSIPVSPFSFHARTNGLNPSPANRYFIIIPRAIDKICFRLSSDPTADRTIALLLLLHSMLQQILRVPSDHRQALTAVKWGKTGWKDEPCDGKSSAHDRHHYRSLLNGAQGSVYGKSVSTMSLPCRNCAAPFASDMKGRRESFCVAANDGGGSLSECNLYPCNIDAHKHKFTRVFTVDDMTNPLVRFSIRSPKNTCVLRSPALILLTQFVCVYEREKKRKTNLGPME